MRFVAEVCTVQGAGRALLWAIAYHADRETGECWTALRKLAAQAGISYTTAKYAKPELLKLGYLELVVEGSGRRPACLRILCSGLTTGPQGGPPSGSATDPLPPVDNPVDNVVVGQSERRSGPIGHSVVGQIGGSPYRNEGKDIEGFEGESAGASSAPPDLPADAVGRRSAGKSRVPPAASAALQELKNGWRRQNVEAQQAERERLERLFGPAQTEPAPAGPPPSLEE
jgi:hypothetical protein